MKKILSIIMAIMAITSASAKTMDVRNTAGTEMTIQISNLEGTQLTFVRTSDNREFTIPLSMLD